MKWIEIDLNHNPIRRLTQKTDKEVIIPIMPPLKKFLEKQYSISSKDKYVLPGHAEMYQTNPSGITWRVKKFLESLGIKTTKVPEGRKRAVSIKDVHSLRHSFCYYAGLYNVPLAIVQAVVGHMSPEMTKHYTMHATSNDIKKAFLNMPDMFEVLDITSETKSIEVIDSDPERLEMAELSRTLPIEEVRNILAGLKSKPKSIQA
ncbi:MAG: tyrosine-type recombinase/integrase [Victivallaceae bacterium]